MIPHLARRVLLQVRRDDDKHDSQIYFRNHLGLRRHPLVAPVVETSPTLFEVHHCVPFDSP